MVRTVVFLVPPRVHLLDLAGPAQVFSTATDVGAAHRLVHVGATPTVQSHQGLDLHVELDWPALGPDDLVVVPGHRVGDGPATPTFPAQLLTHLVAHHDRGGRVASVCSGAFTLAAAGLLDGRRATTHHDLQDTLARAHPAIRVVRDVLFVLDGRITTSAGIASGIDLALHLLTTDHGPALAARVARAMVVPARRNGSDPQHSVMLRHRDHLADVVRPVRRVAATARARPRRGDQRTDPDPAVPRRDGHDTAALPAGDPPRASRPAHRPGLDPGRSRPSGRIHRRPHAAPTTTTADVPASNHPDPPRRPRPRNVRSGT